jgi:transposase
MAQGRRKFDQDFRDGAVRIVYETGKPIAQVARDLGVNAGTLANWVNMDRKRRSGNGVLTEDERAELVRLRRENAELQMQRDDAPMDVKRLRRWLWLVGALPG